MTNESPMPEADAPLVPESQVQNALDALGDLYRTLDEDTANALSEAVNSGNKAVKYGTLDELRNPWAA